MPDSSVALRPLLGCSVFAKLRSLDAAVTCALALTRAEKVPVAPGRDVEVRALADLPPKPGLSTPEGRARLLHDLAAIELQAMELGLRTLAEYPEAPREFREELAELTLSEGRHLALCLEGLAASGCAWGEHPVHLGLWSAVGAEDTLVDRILIVHRYLEGAGLDAGDSILRRLSGVADKGAKQVVEVIVREEVDHVRFGSVWFRRLCEERRLDPGQEFTRRMRRLVAEVPRRERLSRELRGRAGFSPEEMDELERLRGAAL